MGRVLIPIVEQHAEEAAFLWLLRDRAVEAPHYKRHHLARLDERIEANIDGLRVAGDVGWRIALAQLARHQEPGELFTAATLALESAEPERLDLVVTVAETVPDARRGFLGALGWVPPPLLKPTVRRWLDGTDSFCRYLGIVACSHHRVDPGARLAEWLADPSPLVRARALRLMGELGQADLRRAVTVALVEDSDPACRFWAAWSAELLGARAGLSLLMTTAEAGGPLSDPALEVAARLAAPDEAKAWIRRLNGEPTQRRLVTVLLGHLGDPAAVPWLITRMSDPDLARVAGESFSIITGVELAYQDLELKEAPEGSRSGPSDDTADEDVSLKADEHLAWPDRALIQAWWDRNAYRYTRGTRHLLGRTVDAAACDHAWREGFQRQRKAAAYEFRLMSNAGRLKCWKQPLSTSHQ